MTREIRSVAALRIPAVRQDNTPADVTLAFHRPRDQARRPDPALPQKWALSECFNLDSNFVCEAIPRKLRIMELFSGIGGFSLGLERTGGFETAAFCEIEPWPQRVLRKHWPDIPLYDVVREVNADRLSADGIIGIDVVTGGFPFQDLSAANRRAGIGGERGGVWSEVHRLIGELRHLYSVMENVWSLFADHNNQPEPRTTPADQTHD